MRRCLPPDGATVPEHMIHVLRRSMFPLGQIQGELKRRGLAGAQWHRAGGWVGFSMERSGDSLRVMAGGAQPS